MRLKLQLDTKIKVFLITLQLKGLTLRISV